MKSPVFTLMFALAALVALPGTLSASESYRFFTQNDAKLASSRTPVFYLSGSVFNDTNNNRVFDPGDRSGVASSLTLFHLVNGEWKQVNATPVRTSSSGAYTFAVFQRGSYRVGVKYGNNPNGAFSQIRGFKVGVAVSGSRRVLNIPFVTPQTAAQYGMTTTRNPHRPPVSATPIR
jgi:hypothetical protein